MSKNKIPTNSTPASQADDLADDAAGIGALANPLRRRLYEYVSSQDDAVGREAAAAALGVPLHRVRTQLDRLADEGLLDIEFRRLSGRTGPGAGRPAKLYRRSQREFSVSLPARRYDLVGHILATAIEATAADGLRASEVMDGIAYDEGRKSGDGCATDELGPIDRLSCALGELGYEPKRTGDTLSLRNCPFDTVSKEHTELVCGLCRSFVHGVCDAVDAGEFDAVLDPESGLCCVKIALH